MLKIILLNSFFNFFKMTTEEYLNVMSDSYQNALISLYFAKYYKEIRNHWREELEENDDLKNFLILNLINMILKKNNFKPMELNEVAEEINKIKPYFNKIENEKINGERIKNLIENEKDILKIVQNTENKKIYVINEILTN